MQRQILTYWALMLAVFLTLPEKASADLSAGQVVSMNPCPQPHSSDMIYSFFDNGVGEKVSNPILTAWSDPRLSGVIYCGHEKTYYAYSSLWSSPLTLTISHKVSPGSVEEKFLLPPKALMSKPKTANGSKSFHLIDVDLSPLCRGLDLKLLTAMAGSPSEPLSYKTESLGLCLPSSESVDLIDWLSTEKGYRVLLMLSKKSGLALMVVDIDLEKIDARTVITLEDKVPIEENPSTPPIFPDSCGRYSQDARFLDASGEKFAVFYKDPRILLMDIEAKKISEVYNGWTTGGMTTCETGRASYQGLGDMVFIDRSKNTVFFHNYNRDLDERVTTKILF